jgi:hypothetical protein
MKKTLVPLIILSVIILSACRKQADTIANIYVKDEASLVVDSAMVILYGENTTGLPNQIVVFDSAYTNSKGMATFDYNYLYKPGQSGVAVLSIKVQKDNKNGIGIIKIEEEKVNEETVFIQP